MLSPGQRRLVAFASLLSAVLIAVLLAAGSRPVLKPEPTPGALRFDPLKAIGYTRALAGGYPDRITGTPASRRASDFLQRTFESLGYRVTLQRFMLWANGERVEGVNVIAAQRHPPPMPYVAVLAHYDGAPTTHQAAEDDASGVGTMLELARTLRGRAIRPVFIATDAEELGMIGARNAAAFLHSQGEGAAVSIDYVPSGASRGIQLTSMGQFHGYTPVALRALAIAAVQEQHCEVVYQSGVTEFIDRAIERSLQDQGPLLDERIPAVNFISIPADLAASRERYHSPMDVDTGFQPQTFDAIGRSVERTLLTLSNARFEANDGFMTSSTRYVPYAVARQILFVPLLPLLVAAVCVLFGLADGRANARDGGASQRKRAFAAAGGGLLALTFPGLVAYAIVRALVASNVIPRFELYPPPPKAALLSHPPSIAVAAILAGLIGGYSLLARLPIPRANKGRLLVWTVVLALCAYFVNPFGLWLYLGAFSFAALLMVERRGRAVLAINVALMVFAAVPVALVITYFAREIFVGPFIWWYLVLQFGYGTWSFAVAAMAIVAAILWLQFVRLAFEQV